MKRLEIAPGDICPVCQEDIREIDEEGTSLQGVRAGQLTFCRDGCGNNLHTRCGIPECIRMNEWGTGEVFAGTWYWVITPPMDGTHVILWIPPQRVTLTTPNS